MIKKLKSFKKYFIFFIFCCLVASCIFIILNTKIQNKVENNSSQNPITSDKKNSNFKLKTYSRCGEDIALSYILDRIGIEKPFYIDIGAHDPYLASNTAVFHEQGGKGINIDANPNLIKTFEEKRAEDINLNIGVGAKEGEFEFYIFDNLKYSTFNKEIVESKAKAGSYHKDKKIIPVKTLKYVIEKYCNEKAIDLLAIDTEGEDFNILSSYDFSNKKNDPKVIIMESFLGEEHDLKVKKLMFGHEYFFYFKNEINLIFIKNEFKNLFNM